MKYNPSHAGSATIIIKFEEENTQITRFIALGSVLFLAFQFWEVEDLIIGVSTFEEDSKCRLILTWVNIR